ncbi:hypothetical protein Ancab_036746 [Ancistrocladus abbreviatus]
MASDSKLFTFEEVAKHDRKNDCWLIISEKVYDVTPFLDDHPGGDDVLLGATGKDATDEFEDVGHSDDARGMMKKYYVGEVDVSTFPTNKKHVPQPLPPRPNTDNAQGSGLIKLLQFLLPLLVLALAFSLKYLKKE